jgi:transglutaminase-like putative cysteine protease
MEALNSQMMGIPSGKAGTLATLKIMRRVTRRYKSNLTIRVLAQKLTRRLPQKNYTAEVRALHRFVQQKIRYVKDIRGVETIQTPIQTLKLGSGDCDDKSIMVASLLESIGHPTRFVACGFGVVGGFSHVFVQTKIGGKWVSVECTEPWSLGKAPPNITTRMIVRN